MSITHEDERIQKFAKEIASEASMYKQVAAILPRMRSRLVTGSVNKGSNEPRSRSPAVKSIAG